METRVETFTLTPPHVGTIEVGTLIHDGHEYTAMGAVLEPMHPVVYLVEKDGKQNVTDWHGTILGQWWTTSTWRKWSSYGLYTMSSVGVYLNTSDVTGWYHGRLSFDSGQCVRLTRDAKQA
jgi:hypothetical protein